MVKNIFSATRLYISCVFLLHLFCVLTWSGTCLRVYGSSLTASSHISCVWRWSGTYDQWVWLHAHCFVTHFLCLKMISNITQGVWFPAHCLITHLLRHKMIWDNFQCRWIHAQSHIVHLLRKTVRSLFYPEYDRHIYLISLDRARIKIYTGTVIFVSNNFKTTICYFHNFSVFRFHLQEHTNPTILMDARQWALTHLLFLLFVTCVFDNHCTT